jgi:hypothetical protein
MQREPRREQSLPSSRGLGVEDLGFGESFKRILVAGIGTIAILSIKLYVSNLSPVATLASMRQLFGTCGEVLEVEFAPERRLRSGPSAAYVTMANSSAAEKALHDLHGRMHGDRVLAISRMFGDADGASQKKKPATVDAKVAITQQYRDRHGLTYELSCADKLLTLRFLFPADDAHDWQVEAQVSPGPTSAAKASAMTREQALSALIVACSAPEDALAASGLDWEGVVRALRAVRAV